MFKLILVKTNQYFRGILLMYKFILWKYHLNKRKRNELRKDRAGVVHEDHIMINLERSFSKYQEKNNLGG